MKIPKVIVVGLGFCGLQAAYKIKSIQKGKIEVVGINNTNYYTFIPSLHNLGVGKIKPEQITIDLKKALVKRNINFVKGELKNIDTKKNTVILKDNKKVSYDYLIISTGSENNFFNNINFQNNTLGLRWLSDAIKIQNHLKKFEQEITKNKYDENWLNFVIIGGGITGTEMCGELNDYITRITKKYKLKTKPAIYLVHLQDRILQGYPTYAQIKAQKYLEKIGIKLILNNKAKDIQKNKVILEDGKEILANTIIWTSGLTSSSTIKNLPLEHDKKGNIILEETMQVKGYKNIFAGGDVLSFKDEDINKTTPRTARQSEYQGKFIAENLIRLIKNQKLKNYKPKPNPIIISLGDKMGFITYRNITIFSFWWSFAKKVIEWWYLFWHR